MTPEEWQATQQGLHNKASGLPLASPYGKSPAAPGAPAADPPSSTISSDLYEAGRGALKGATSNITGLMEAGHKAIGTPEAPQFMQDFAKPGEGESGWEQAGRIGGEYGSLMIDQFIPGLNVAADASIGTRLAVDAIKGSIGGMAGTGDPEGAKSGSATGAGATLLKTAGRALYNRIPSPIRHIGEMGVGVGGAMAVHNAMQPQHGGHGAYVPTWYLAHGIPSAISALAALALGAPPAAQGRAGAELYKDYGNSQ